MLGVYLFHIKNRKVLKIKEKIYLYPKGVHKFFNVLFMTLNINYVCLSILFIVLNNIFILLFCILYYIINYKLDC